MAEIIEIGKEQAIALLQRAVEEKGASYRYESSTNACTYADQGAPSCIVGHALYYVGVPVESLVKLDSADTFSAWPQGTDTDDIPPGTSVDYLHSSDALAKLAGVRLTNEAERIFEVAQVEQDAGRPWGEAVAKVID